MTKLHELTGKITSKELRKVYDKKSPYHGNIHYKVQALIENKKKEESLFVYPNLLLYKKIFAVFLPNYNYKVIQKATKSGSLIFVE